MYEKKWRKTGHGIKYKKRNEYFGNLPSQNRSDSGGSCAFSSVRTWNVLFVEFSGVELSFPSFLSAPSSSTHHHHHTTHTLQTSPSMARTKVCLFYLLTLSSFRCSFSLSSLSYVANRTQIDWRWVSFHAAFTFWLNLPFLSSSSNYPGKAPRKQLATKAARKTAQVWLLVSVVAVDDITLNFFFFLFHL